MVLLSLSSETTTCEPVLLEEENTPGVKNALTIFKSNVKGVEDVFMKFNINRQKQLWKDDPKGAAKRLNEEKISFFDRRIRAWNKKTETESET